MSRRERARANARPWLQQRDDADSVADIIEQLSDDERKRDIAWQQHEHDQQQGAEQ